MEATSSGGGDDRGIHALCDDALMQILVRLPSKSVLRCRAVCKNWRRITADRGFLAAHAARRPREMIMQSHDGCWDVESVPLDVMSPQEKDRRRRFLCRCARGDGRCYYVIHSLDGLLVLRQQRRWGLFVICNPTTRQWINLPELAQQSYVSVCDCGFYLHVPSGEYRLLCHAIDRHELESPGPLRTLPRYYHVLSTGAVLPRRLGQAPNFSTFGDHEDPVAHRGVLHWIVHPQADLTGKMLAFDTDSETFRLMSRPPEDKATMMMMTLFEHDGELNAAAMHSLTSLNVWVLRDYKAETWTLRHRVDHLPRPFYSGTLSVTNVLSVGSGGVIVIGGRGCTVGRMYDLQAKRVISTDFFFHGSKEHGCAMFLAFNESLVPHAFFDTPRCPDLEPIYFCPDLEPIDFSCPDLGPICFSIRYV